MPSQSPNVELRLRAAVESSPSGLLMIDAAGTIVLVNRQVELLFGYSREEMLGRPVEMLVPERFRGHHPAFRTGFVADPRIRAMGQGRDLFGLRKDGTEIPVEIGLNPVATDEGLFVISSIVDISERKRAEARFRAAVESSPNGMLMTDKDGRIIMVNLEAERLFGYRREEMLNQPIEMLVPARFRDHHPGNRSEFHRDPRTRVMGAGRDLYGLRKDGTEIPVEIGLTPIQTDEGVVVLSSVVDISPRKNAERALHESEERLRQSQKMEAVGTLAGGIAHDFNNLLSAILGFGELVREEVKGTPSLRSDMDELLQAADRGKKLVERILAFSRRQELERRPTSLPVVTQETIDLLRSTLPSTIEIVRSLDLKVPRVLADTTAIQQVIMNLATNAAHAMPRGGHLRIALSEHYVRDSEARNNPDLHEGPYNVLTVQDTGIGMDDETRIRAFEPFFTTKAPGTGTGLGLSMVHAVMHDHEGAVVVQSELGKGTLVRCYFPILQLEVQDPGALDFEVPTGQGQRILYLDDEPSLARLGARRLENLNYLVEFATDSRQALELLRQAPDRFDLVITDYTMPRLTGIDFSREVHAIRADLPIIMLSGYIEQIPSERLEEAGIQRLLLKPVSIEDLANAVHTVLAE
jgi:PAS domain S-box-containing protein